MNKHRRHLIGRMRNDRISPQNHRSQQRSIGKCENDREQYSSGFFKERKPEVNQDQKVCEVAEVEEKVVVFYFLVGVPTIAEE